MQIGFIGVGAMGGGLARNLIRAGKEVAVFDLNPAAVEKTLAAGTTGRAAASTDELAEADVVFTSLPLPDDVKNIMLGEDGLLSKLKKGAAYFDVSTIDPKTARALSDACGQKGIDFLECPLGKTPAHAEKAEEPIFVGGKPEVFEKHKDLLAIVGTPVVYMGEVEASAAFKLISNMVGMANLAILAEGLRLAEKAGIEPGMFLEQMADTGGHSFQLSVRGPWIVQKDFAPRFGLDLALKDVRLGCEMADDWGLGIQAMRRVLDYFKAASQAGFGKEDCNAVYKVVT